MDPLSNGSSVAGPLLEDFAGTGLLKQLAWSEVPSILFHDWTAGEWEGDEVLKDCGRRVIGLEVKTSATVGIDGLKGLEDLAGTTGKRFHRGAYYTTGTTPFFLAGVSMHWPSAPSGNWPRKRINVRHVCPRGRLGTFSWAPPVLCLSI